MSQLFVFGLGYTAHVLGRRLLEQGWLVSGTVRGAGKAERLEAEGFAATLFDGAEPAPKIARALTGCDHVLVSIAPPEGGDPVLAHHRDDLAARAETIRWLGYLSTVGVYGDHGGDWIDETTLPRPGIERTRRRVAAETAWLEFGVETGIPVMIFRIAGIYGPGRNQLLNLKAGTARRIVKPGQVFNRIHVEDIATTLSASMAAPRGGAIYNVADDHPAPPQDVIAHAADILGVTAPPETPFEHARMTPMARSFYSDSKRVSNARIKTELRVRLAYPDYRTGLAALHAAGEGA